MSVIHSDLPRFYGSIYALEEHTKQWIARGTAGNILMFPDSNGCNFWILRHSKDNSSRSDWNLLGSPTKNKGERALVLKAMCTKTQQIEILAIRLKTKEDAISFVQTYDQIFAPNSSFNLYPPAPPPPAPKRRRIVPPKPLRPPPIIIKPLPPQPQIQWICSHCSYSNNQFSSQCAMCHCSNGINEKWDCPKCTFSNDSHNEKCQICNVRKPDGSVSPISPIHDHEDGTWKCTMCTLVNSNDTSRCIACDTVRSLLSSEDESSSDNDKQMPIFVNDSHPTLYDFERTASDIACYNDDPYKIYSTLRSVAKKLLKKEVRYRTLDTANPKVQERLIGFDGVLDYLSLLGFESDTFGTKLVCKHPPSPQIVSAATAVLLQYQQRFIMTNNGRMNVDNVHVQSPGFESFDDEKNDDQNTELTLEQIIEIATHEGAQDLDTMNTLTLTHKMFTNSLTLLKLLRKRFNVPIPNELRNNGKLIKEFQLNIVKPIQLKVISSIKNWMKRHWTEDFGKCELVKNELCDFLRELSVYNQLSVFHKNCVWIPKCFAIIKGEYERLSRINWKNVLHSDYDFYANVDEECLNLSKLNVEECADQITLMDFRIFSKIESREFTQQRWKDNDYKLAPNILRMIDGFNCFTTFIQMQILREESLKKRAIAIKRVIKMGKRFEFVKNYFKLCGVFSALSSAPIHRLKCAWNRVSERNKAQFEEWRNIFSPKRNHRNLRQVLMTGAGRPCIPHIGIFCQDLIFIEEGCKKKIKMDAFNGNKMLNFGKCVRIVDRIKNVKMFQLHKYDAILSENKRLQKMLFLEFESLKDVTEDELWDMSTQIVQKDAKEMNKKSFAFFH